MRLGRWRARPRDRELSLPTQNMFSDQKSNEGCFGATPKVRAALALARETRALPRRPVAYSIPFPIESE